MPWEVVLHSRVQKALDNLSKALSKKLFEKIESAFKLLFGELESFGPVRGTWPNYSKLDNNRHHCHLKKGKPTYVAVWNDLSTDTCKKIEVEYVGTHEKAPY